MMLYAIMPEDIAACESQALLRLWHSRFYDDADRLSSELSALRDSGRATVSRVEPMERKLAKARMAMKGIERRMIEIGGDPIATRRNGQRNRIRALEAEVEALNKELAQYRRKNAA